MLLRYYKGENGHRVYTLKKIDPNGNPTLSAHPARFSPADTNSRQRILIKQRFGLLPTQQNSIDATMNVLDTNLEPRPRRKKPRVKMNLYHENLEVKKMNQFRVAESRLDGNIFVYRKSLEKEKGQIPNPVATFKQAFGYYEDFALEIYKKKIHMPLPLQSQAWPIILSNNDVVCIGGSGTGKKLSFLLPGLLHIQELSKHDPNRKGPIMLCLSPTPESASQIKAEFDKFSPSNIKCACNYDISGDGYEMIAAAPEQLQTVDVDFSSVSFVVLEEADKMAKSQILIDNVFSRLSKPYQIVMTSTTWCESIQELASSRCENPVKVVASSLDLTTIVGVTQECKVVRKQGDKLNEAVDYLKVHTNKPNDRIVLFCNTEWTAQDIEGLIFEEIRCSMLLVDTNAVEREKTLENIKNGDDKILLTTVATCDLPLTSFTHVFIYDFPKDIEEYVHLICRTRENGGDIKFISLLNETDWPIAPDLIAILRKTKQEIPPIIYDLANQFKKIMFLENPTFPQLVEANYFVDKSMIIENILSRRDQFLFTAPRKMGKTAILKMLECFFSIDTDKENLAVFKKLKIGKNHPELLESHFGHYPVLQVDMSDFNQLIVKSQESCYVALRRIMHSTYLRYEHIFPDNDEVKLWTNPLSYGKQSDDVTAKALYQLAVLLRNHYKKPLVLLCDEFDSICENALSNKVADKKLDEICRTYFAIFTGLVKTDKRIKKKPDELEAEVNELKDEAVEDKPKDDVTRLIKLAIFSGITAITCSGQSPLNTLDPDGFLHSPVYSQFYGILKEEFEELLNKPEFEKLRDEKPLALTRYNGYTSCNQENILCTYSISKYLSNVGLASESRLINYWVKSGSADRYTRVWTCTELRQTLQAIVQGKSVPVPNCSNISANSLAKLHDVIESGSLSKDNIGILYIYMQQLGYFDIFKYDDNSLLLRIPNGEIRSVFSEMLVTALLTPISLKDEQLLSGRRLFNQLICADETDNTLKQIETVLSKLCKSLPKINEKLCLNEATFEHIIYSILIRSNFEPISQKGVMDENKPNESYWKKFDLFFYYGNFRILIELKYGTGENEKKALRQIKDCKYYELFDKGQIDVTFTRKLFVGMHASINGDVTITSTSDIEKYEF